MLLTEAVRRRMCKLSSSISTHQTLQLSRDPALGRYELFAILIHSGSAQGGHYHAFIKDTIAQPCAGAAATADRSAGWCDYNDAQVTPLDLPTLARVMGGTATAQPRDGLAEPEPEAESQTGPESNAYMLVYRRRDGTEQDAGLRATTQPGMTELLPAEMRGSIEAEGERYVRLRALYDFQQRLVELR